MRRVLVRVLLTLRGFFSANPPYRELVRSYEASVPGFGNLARWFCNRRPERGLCCTPRLVFFPQTRYMELCGMSGKTYRETDVTLKSILSKHDTLDGNRLSLDGFLSYYREVAAADPRQVRISGS